MLRATVIFALVFAKTVFSQEANSCSTPRGSPGLCINIKECKGLVTLLRTNGNDPEVRTYLIRSTCGYSGTVPLVCCPQATNQGTTNSPATEPTYPVTNPGTGSTGTTGSGTTGGGGTSVDGLLRPPNCGLSNDTTGRVVGGVPANLGEFPWAVVLGYRNNNNPRQPKWLCGGSLISDRHILTAAHCVSNRPDLYMARLGDLDLYSDTDGASPEDIPLVKAKIHENYNGGTFTSDIAILTLARAPDLTKVWPVCLPVDEPLRSNNFEKHYGFVAGWGTVEFKGMESPNLLKAFIPIVTNEACKSAYSQLKTIIDERVLCAGYAAGGKDACQGDSGGPFMLGRTEPKNKRFYQIGVVSYGFRCAEAGYPGVYTRVTEFIDWIARNLN